MWLGVVDFEKAFDTVDHPMLWRALDETGVEPCYVNILQRLYASQEAVVDVGVKSRAFPLQRGVKHGDPISGLLFLAVMEVCFRSLTDKWRNLNSRRKGQYYGFVIDDPEDPMTNLRFADDVLLLGQSPRDIRNMLEHLRLAAETYGLKLHMGKTKVFTTAPRNRKTCLKIGEDTIDVLSGEASERYLGRKLCLASFHEAELDNRIRAAWAAFSKHRCVFASNSYTFASKAKLFNSTVTPVALYGCAGWTLTKEMELRLRTAQRKMLRTMLCKRRRPDEEWVSFLKRTTALVESRMQQLGYKTWIGESRAKKWRFASRTVMTVDNRWSKRLLEWTPFFGCVARRSVGHPHCRWEDSIIEVAGSNWPAAASDSELWSLLEAGFVDRSVLA